MPRRVNFCPFCGLSQRAGEARPGDAAAAVPVPVPEPVTAAATPALIAMPVPGPEPTPEPIPEPPPEPPLVAAAPLPPFPDPPRPVQTPASVPRPPAATPAPRPLRAPLKMRYWVLALGVLWLIWITQRPPAIKRIEARIDGAIALASACKGAQAQAELAALKVGSATLGQLQRLEAALTRADLACERKRTRARASPAPAPASKAGKPPAGAQAESARNLIADARQALAQGDYKSAADKMEVCLAMLDAGNRECGALKAKAQRLQGALQRCLGDGREWIGERCQ